jgi:hypothetical protein
MTVNTSEIALSSYKVSNDWLISPATFLVDSYVPYVEKIYLHETSTAAGKLRFKLIDGVSETKLKKTFIQKLLISLKGQKNIDNNFVFIDLRANSPHNISHAIMMHLPLILFAERHFEDYLQQKELLLVLPANIPSYIVSLFQLLDYKLLLTDSAIKGVHFDYDIDLWQQFRGELSQVLKHGVTDTTFIASISKLAKQQPRKIFISRKDSRKLKNELVIEDILSSNGYTKVYAEDYSVIEQISMVSHADSIVAIHGAALGLMAFRALFDLPSIKLIELFPPSHMTNVYRILTQQLGGNWVGVRGKVWPELIEHAYADANVGAIREYSLSDFEVCEKSLLTALEWLDEND